VERVPPEDGEWALRVLDAAVDAVVTVDAGGRVLRVNRSAERMFGRQRPALVGRPLAELVAAPDPRSERGRAIGRLLAGREPRLLGRRVRMRGLRDDGASFPAELTLTRTFGAPLRFTGFVRELATPVAVDQLSERELEVLRLAADGNSGPQIAAELRLSPATVKSHFEHIYEKLGLGDRVAAVAYALRAGLID
jgi:PAS domain S-box-containing protein